MKLQKVGGVASICTAALLVIVLAIIFLVLPRLGIVGPGDWGDPAKSLDAWNASPITFLIFDLEFILFSIVALLLVLALRERMEAGAPNLMWMAVIGGSIASAFWLTRGLVGIVGMPSIVTAKDASAFRAAIAMFFGLESGADFALGWALLVTGCAALRTRRLPRMLGYFSLLKGAVMIIDFAAQPLMLFGIVLGIIFYPWLGIVLLRSQDSLQQSA